MHQQVKRPTTVRSAHTVFICFVFISEQTATYATYSINWLVFKTEMKSVYCAVRTGALWRLQTSYAVQSGTTAAVNDSHSGTMKIHIHNLFWSTVHSFIYSSECYTAK